MLPALPCSLMNARSILTNDECDVIIVDQWMRFQLDNSDGGKEVGNF